MPTQYKKGEILNLDIQENLKGSNVLYGVHRVVVLHHKPSPYDIVLIAPITSAEALKQRDSIPNTYVPLLEDDYPIVLDHDSYICLDTIVAIDLHKLETFKKGMFSSIKATLNPEDLLTLDMKIILKFELQDFVDKVVKENVKEIVSYIDEHIKKTIEELHVIIKDEDILSKTIDTFKVFVLEIKKIYQLDKNK